MKTDTVNVGANELIFHKITQSTSQMTTDTTRNITKLKNITTTKTMMKNMNLMKIILRPMSRLMTNVEAMARISRNN